MINEKNAKTYCSEDISNIENYELAINDTTQTWEIHHRGEVLPCGRFSPNDLKKFGLYFNRPASELIFLTKAEHTRLHWKGVPNHYLKGVPKSEAHKKALSEAHKKALSKVHSKKILQFTKSGEFIKEWPSFCEAERELGIAKSNICSCCNGKLKSAGGFIWMYK